MTAKRLPKPAPQSASRHKAAELLARIVSAHRYLQFQAEHNTTLAAKINAEVAVRKARALLEQAIDDAAEYFSARPTSTAAALTTPTRGSRELLAALSLHFATASACESFVAMLSGALDELPPATAAMIAARRQEIGEKSLELFAEADRLQAWLAAGNADLGEPLPPAWIAERQAMLLELDLCAGLLDAMTGSGPVHAQRIRRLIASTQVAGEAAVADEILEHYGQGFLLPAGTFRGGVARISFDGLKPAIAFEVDHDGGLRRPASVVDREVELARAEADDARRELGRITGKLSRIRLGALDPLLSFAEECTAAGSGCASGDCPHAMQVECTEASNALLREIAHDARRVLQRARTTLAAHAEDPAETSPRATPSVPDDTALDVAAYYRPLTSSRRPGFKFCDVHLSDAEAAEILSRGPGSILSGIERHVLPKPIAGVPMLQPSAPDPTDSELFGKPFKAGDRISFVNQATGELRSYVLCDPPPLSSIERWGRTVKLGTAQECIDEANARDPEGAKLLEGLSATMREAEQRTIEQAAELSAQSATPARTFAASLPAAAVFQLVAAAAARAPWRLVRTLRPLVLVFPQRRTVQHYQATEDHRMPTMLCELVDGVRWNPTDESPDVQWICIRCEALKREDAS